MAKPQTLLALSLLGATFILARMEAGILCLWPSLVAILAVILFRSALPSLLIGAACGSILLCEGQPVRASTSFFTNHLLPSLQSEWNLSVLAFTFLLGGFAALLESGRGFEGILGWFLRGNGNTGKRVQWSAYAMGTICFFDGLASSLLTGKAIRPLADKTGVSRAKLAYIVDSTSSAVACVAIMSTWIAYQLSMIREGYAQAGIVGNDPFSVFLQSIPRNYYCWFTLALLAVAIRKPWNPGPMGKHEDKTGGNKTSLQHVGLQGQAWRATVPLIALVFCLFAGLYIDGSGGDAFPLSLGKLKEAFGDARSNLVLLYASATACLVAWACNASPILESKQDPGKVFMDGMQRFFSPCLILVAAWCLGSTLAQLDASGYLSNLLKGNLPPQLFPLAVFLLGVLVSFTTGTSWGTMGVLMPLALPVSFALAPGNEAMVASVVAAVFSGAVFGDHCSPLSDTTIVSAMSCDLEPFVHVHTQLPYALTAAIVASVCGFLPLGFGTNPWICLTAGFISILVIPMLHSRFPRKNGAEGNS
jgi:tetracycline resistance efflux pump